MYREYDVFPLISHHVVQFFSSFDSFDSYQKNHDFSRQFKVLWVNWIGYLYLLNLISFLLLPFIQVKATKPDGSPMKGAHIKIVISGRRRRLLDKYFIVPESGLVEFSINGSAIPSYAKSLNLQVSKSWET